MSRLLFDALTAEDNKFRCFRLGETWVIMRGDEFTARTDRPALAFALLRSFIAYGKETRR